MNTDQSNQPYTQKNTAKGGIILSLKPSVETNRLFRSKMTLSNTLLLFVIVATGAVARPINRGPALVDLPPQGKLYISLGFGDF
jgi:hypothetical protein